MAYAVSRSSQLQEQQATIDQENNLADTEATCLAGSAAVASSPIVKEIQDMIEFAYSHCKPAGFRLGTGNSNATSSDSNGMIPSSLGSAFDDASTVAFLLDELCYAVQGGRLVAPICTWLNDLYQAEFEDFYVGDFEEEGATQGTKGAPTSNMPLDQIPKSASHLALLNGTSTNAMAPKGELRFNIAGAESIVYLKLLPLLSSHNHTEREFVPVQLCPMFRLMSTINDPRYGGQGLSEIDAMLECPLLLPAADESGIDFEDLSTIQQWVVTSSFFFSTCWIRQLLNSFIYAADECSAPSPSQPVSAPPPAAGSFTCSQVSQVFSTTEVQKKIVERLKALVELEEELRFTSSHCLHFAPPGMSGLLLRRACVLLSPLK